MASVFCALLLPREGLRDLLDKLSMIEKPSGPLASKAWQIFFGISLILRDICKCNE